MIFAIILWSLFGPSVVRSQCTIDNCLTSTHHRPVSTTGLSFAEEVREIWSELEELKLRMHLITDRLMIVLNTLEQNDDASNRRMDGLERQVQNATESLQHSGNERQRRIDALELQLSNGLETLQQDSVAGNRRIDALQREIQNATETLQQGGNARERRIESLQSQLSEGLETLQQNDDVTSRRMAAFEREVQNATETLQQSGNARNRRIGELESRLSNGLETLQQNGNATNGRVNTLQSQFRTLQSQVNAVASNRGVSRCRLCFREIEGSSQCQRSRSTCSGWSSSPSWTSPFRDDTDGRGGGCTYQWRIECA